MTILFCCRCFEAYIGFWSRRLWLSLRCYGTHLGDPLFSIGAHPPDEAGGALTRSSLVATDTRTPSPATCRHNDHILTRTVRPWFPTCRAKLPVDEGGVFVGLHILSHSTRSRHFIPAWTRPTHIRHSATTSQSPSGNHPPNKPTKMMKVQSQRRSSVASMKRVDTQHRRRVDIT